MITKYDVGEDNILKKLSTIGEAYVVGGTVRDYLLGIQPKDRDYVLYAKDTGKAMKDILKKFDYPMITQLELNDGSVVLLFPGWDVRIIKTFGTREQRIEYIAKTSDFTCNALIVDGDGNIHDPTLRGEEAIARKVIIPVRGGLFQEEPRTVLRALRLSITRGLKLVLETKKAITLLNEETVSTIDPILFYVEFAKAYNESPEYGLRFMRALREYGIFDRHRAFKECKPDNRTLRHFKMRFKWRKITEYPAEFVYPLFFLDNIKRRKSVKHCANILPEFSLFLVEGYNGILNFSPAKKDAILVAYKFGEMLKTRLFREYYEILLHNKYRKKINELVWFFDIMSECAKKLYPNDTLSDVMAEKKRRSEVKYCVLSRLLSAQEVGVDG